MSKWIKTLTAILLASFLGLAQAWANTPGSMIYSGHIIKPDGNPLEASQVTFYVRILSPTNLCLLYEETHTMNMTGSDGQFALSIGLGTQVGADFEDTSSLSDIFSNSLGALSGLNCATGATYTPAAGESRLLRIDFDDGGGPVSFTTDLVIRSVPYSMYASRASVADAIGGVTPASLLVKNETSGYVLNQANLESLFTTAGYANLSNVASGAGGVASVFGRTGAVTAVTGDYAANQITNVPAGGISAAGVQAALNELDTEKQPYSTELIGLSSVVTTGTLERTAAGSYSTYPVTTAGRSFLGAATAGDQRTAMGLGSASTQNTGGAIGNIPTVSASLAAGALVTFDGTGLASASGCVSGQVLEYTGSSWICSNFNGSFLRTDGSYPMTGVLNMSNSDIMSAYVIADGGMGLVLKTSNTTRVFVDTAGNVGIGTLAPAALLDVNGAIQAVTVTQSSDERFKENITPIAGALEQLLSIQGVRYHWRIDEFPDMNLPEGEDMGVIAQNVRDSFPEAVTENSKGFLSVSYSKLVAPIIEAIRELKLSGDAQAESVVLLKAENESLQLQVDALNAKLDELAQRLDASEAATQ